MGRIACFLTFLLLSFNYYATHACTVISSEPDTICICDTCPEENTATFISVAPDRDVMVLATTDSVKTTKFKSKKLIAAILSFPVPFGLLGLHRVFLGTKPYIPFVYIGTIGGCFLIVPLIDFITILSADEEEFKRFENNPKVFMWAH